MGTTNNKDNEVTPPRNILLTICEHLAAIRKHLLDESADAVDGNVSGAQKSYPESTFPNFLSELTRAFCLGGGGVARLDCTIRETIRWYGEAREEIRRVQSDDTLDADRRADSIAGFTRFLTKFQEDLALLGVSIEEVEVGRPLDVKWHRMAEQVSTGDELLLDTVAECIRPAFRWTSVNGEEHREPAIVSVYGKFEKPKRKRRQL